MTYGDIYTKFLIEYDKENITSSYPSLTPYEIATILDKAYLALIAQKVTGNNPRRAAFEADTKAIEDLRPLIKVFINTDETTHVEVGIKPIMTNETPTNHVKVSINASNMISYNLEDISDFLYYVQSTIKVYRSDPHTASNYNTQPVTLISHNDAQKFIQSSVNRPWIKTPIAFLEDKKLNVLIDNLGITPAGNITSTTTLADRYDDLYVTYIKRPWQFVSDGTGPEETPLESDEVRFNNTEFELNDSMAEELIHLALVMALETTQSPQINTTIQTRALES